MKIDVRRWLERLTISVVALFVAAALIDGITLNGWQAAILAGALFGLVNAFVKPVVRTLTCPLYMLSLGLFALVVNAVMLLVTSWVAQALDIGFHVNGFSAALLGALVIGVVSWLVSLAL